MSAPLLPDARQRLLSLFDQAADLAPDERAVFVDAECGDDATLRGELARLVEALDGDDVVERLQAPTPMLPSRTGARIGPYELREKLGEGGMGEVYAAEQREPVRRRVALKLIKRGMDSAQVVARFEAERQALARMEHTHIAHVFDVGVTAEGLPYFAMELVDGEPIDAYCDRHALTTRARLALFVEICEAVQHAHQKGILHRDLKPSNLLVTRQGERAVPKIIDFGLARATTGRLAERTLVGQVVGTLDYMSPEQADPSSLNVDSRSDVYSLGVVLYQLVSGLLPFELSSAAGTPFSEAQRAIREQVPPTPSTRLRRRAATATRVAPLHGTDQRTLIRQLAGDLDWICLKALEKDPARRYASASELAADVRRHLAHEPVLAGRPGALYRAGKFVRRNRAGVIAGSLIAVALVAGAFGVISGRLVARAMKPVADEYAARTLLERADELWPAHPERIDAMVAWLDDARELARSLAGHRARLEDERDPSRRDLLATLVRELEQLDDETGLLAPDAVAPGHGWSVPKRLAFAIDLAEGFAAGGRYAARWAEALAEIPDARSDLDADGEREAVYADLELVPQMGLVPLGPDPDSGLWLFWHLASGAEPARDADGRLVLRDDTGLVLVLVPGSPFLIGAQWEDPDAPHYDPDSRLTPSASEEGPPVQVTVAPFFLSKYEMTQGQWERTQGVNPSAVRPDVGLPADPLNPVNQVTWTECDRVTRQLGLALPSEEEWEYAARAATDTCWFTGNDIGSLQGFANLFDEFALELMGNWNGTTREDVAGLNDGEVMITPIASYRPNPWGLYDVLGNVEEWCRNRPYSYGNPGDHPSTLKLRSIRGGSTRTPPERARSAARDNERWEHDSPALGLRPSRPIEP